MPYIHAPRWLMRITFPHIGALVHGDIAFAATFASGCQDTWNMLPWLSMCFIASFHAIASQIPHQPRHMKIRHFALADDIFRLGLGRMLFYFGQVRVLPHAFGFYFPASFIRWRLTLRIRFRRASKFYLLFLAIPMRICHQTFIGATLMLALFRW